MLNVSPHDESVDGAIDERALAAALTDANMPTLAIVLFHLTGDARWLEPPFRAGKAVGLSDNHGGGYPPEVQEALRSATVEHVLAWAAGAPVAVPRPRRAQVAQMLGTLLGEAPPDAYVDLAVSQLAPSSTAPVNASASAIVIGAGVSGLAAAIKLREIGVDVLLLEKDAELGGTWLENRYPGCGVDTPSALYSFSFFERLWSRHFAKREEVHGYLSDMCDRFELRRSIRFGTEVRSATWETDAQRWVVIADGPDQRSQRCEAQFLITAVGQLNRPYMPSLPGAETFAGRTFHSARWPEDVAIDGQRVVVVGSGASAMQIVPAIAERVAHLTVLQRSPAWVATHENYGRAVSAGERWLLAAVPFYQAWNRLRLAWLWNDKSYSSLVVDPAWRQSTTAVSGANDRTRAALTAYLERELEGRPDLIAAATPSYPPFGKRILLDNGWFRALRRANVSLVSAAIRRVLPDGIETEDGARHGADVLVYATGFQTQLLLAPMAITGRGGVSIRAAWGDDDPSAYLGITAPNFPNAFFLYGPNTNFGHGGSYMFVAECQLRYITSMIAQMSERRIGVVECRADVAAAFRRDLDAAHAGMIWSHPAIGHSWYRNARGRVVANWPWRAIDYWERTRAADLADFEITTSASI